MSTTTHTPGPWRFDWDDNGFYYIDAAGRPSPCIATIPYDGEVAEENARLIAASPDLLEVAEIEQELHTMGYTKATAKRLGKEAEEAYLSAGVLGLNDWCRRKREAAIRRAREGK